MNVMMLTAGEGTRLRPHTLFMPKPTIPFLNIPLYAYSLNFLKSIDVSKVVMNTFHLPQKLMSDVNSRDQFNPYPIQFSNETTLMGSGGGLWQAREHFQRQGDFILMNGDEIAIPNESDVMKKALAAHRTSGAIATLLVMEHPEVGSKFGGVWVDKQSHVMGFGKVQIEGSTKGFHYIGVAILSDRIFNYIAPGESNILYDGVVNAIKDGQKASIFSTHCHWFETGNETDFKMAAGRCLEILSQKNEESKYLSKILKSQAPNSQFTKTENGFVLTDRSSRYDMDSFSGFAVLGENVALKKGCRLRNTILGPHVQIRNADQLEDKMIIDYTVSY